MTVGKGTKAGQPMKSQPGKIAYSTKKTSKDYHPDHHNVKKSHTPYSKGTGKKGGNLTQDMTKALVWAVQHPREVSMLAHGAHSGAKAIRKAFTGKGKKKH